VRHWLLLGALLVGCAVPEPGPEPTIAPATPTPEVAEPDFVRDGRLACGAAGWVTDVDDVGPDPSHEAFQCFGPVAAGAQLATDGVFSVQTNPLNGLAGAAAVRP